MDNTGDLGSLLNSILSGASSEQTFHGDEAAASDAKAAGAPPQDDTPQDEGPDIMGILLRLMPLMSSLNSEDDSTRLLTALQPFLSKEKAKRVDDAKKLLTLLRVVSALRDMQGSSEQQP